MTITTSDEMLDKMADVMYEPTRLLGFMMGNLEAAFDGEKLVVDPSMPWVSLIEQSVLLTAGAIQRDEILNMRQYAVMAQTEDDLYYHLSDKDFEGMFTTPASGTFDIYLSKEEILQYAVRVGTTGTRRLTIPKHTEILVNGSTYTFQYAINILVKSHGALDVVYDGSRLSPLQALRGNKVDWDEVTAGVTDDNGGRVTFVRLRVPIKQMLLTSYKYSLSDSKTFKKVLELTDEFYYVRAFSKLSDNTWLEIKTTHSQQVFDPEDPTLLYKLVGNELTVELPYVYFATNLTTRDIRIDVYTTKGPMNVSLSGLTPDAYTATFKDLDDDDSRVYYAPLGLMATISVISTDIISGGAAAPDFDTRRNRVLTNAVGDSDIPISDAQMGTALAELGFDSMMNIDDITNRTYLATRAMPDNAAGRASTGIDSAVLTMKTAITDILDLKTLIANGTRFTLTPKTLYRYTDGVLRIVSDKDREAIDLLRNEALVNKVSDGTYLYTPLHYVLDIGEDEFHARPYFLDSPEMDVTSFIASNDTLGLTVSSSADRVLVRDEDGYIFRVRSSSNAAWQVLADDQVHVQLAFKPAGESDYAYINGTQIAKTSAGERWYEFRLNTNWDITSNHLLTLTNFNMYEAIERDYPTALEQDYSLIWAVSDYTIEGASASTVDTDLGEFLLPEDTLGIYHETITFTLGNELSGLWARSRSMIGLRKYLTYATDVQAVHRTNVYATDENNVIIIEGEGADRKPKILYAKGSVVLDGDGEPQLAHRAGDAILDENGNPILEDERNVIRWWDVVLFDAVYRYATDVNDVEYAQSAPKILSEWINDTLAGVRDKLLERTDLFFQPRNTLKYVECLVEDSEPKSLNTAQSLVIDYYVSKEVYGDNDIRTALEETGIAQVVAGLNAVTVSRNTLEAAIRDKAGTDIVSVRVSGLGGMENDYNVITVLDESSRLCVAKALTTQPDGTYAVIDAIEVNFKRHAQT